MQLDFKNSEKLQRRAGMVMPGGTQSAVRSIATVGKIEGYTVHCPKFFKRGNGSKLYDVDENEFIDHHLAFGPLILGHSNLKIKNAIEERLKDGWLVGGNREEQIELAERIISHIPCAEMVQFLNTGSAATTAALRIAKAYTEKEKIIRFDGHYHGWHDWSYFDRYGAGDLNSHGIPREIIENVIVLPWNELEVIENMISNRGHEIAAVITEPHLFNKTAIPPKEGYLEGLRRITRRNNVLLIFDEIITGFRMGLGGAQDKYGVTPDLTTFAKAMANGFPLSAVVGREEYMGKIREKSETPPGRIFLAGTYNANLLAMIAGLTAISQFEKRDNYDHLYSMGEEIIDGIKDAVEDTGVEAVIQGIGPGFSVFFTGRDKIVNAKQVRERNTYPHTKRQAIFFQEMINNGIFLWPKNTGRMYVSMAHTEKDATKTIEAAQKALKKASKVG